MIGQIQYAKKVLLTLFITHCLPTHVSFVKIDEVLMHIWVSRVNCMCYITYFVSFGESRKTHISRVDETLIYQHYSQG